MAAALAKAKYVYNERIMYIMFRQVPATVDTQVWCECDGDDGSR